MAGFEEGKRIEKSLVVHERSLWESSCFCDARRRRF